MNKLRRLRVIPLALLTAPLIAVVLSAAPSTPASAAPVGTIGTPLGGITARSYVDTYANFTIVDTAQTASANGWLTSINYWAQATGTIQFLLVDGSNKVQWVSGSVTVTSIGSKVDTLPAPVQVQAGWRLGYYT